MSSQLYEAIRLLVQEKGISEELIHRTIEEFLLAAYKRKFGTSDNAVVRFSEEEEGVTLFARREIVEDVYDPVTEIDLEEALTFSPEAEIGDEMLIEINPMEFDRVAVQSAKQKAKQTLREIQKDTLYSEFIDKVGEMIIGYYQRERNGNIFVDLGKTEGLMPKRYQSPREMYRPNDRIKALIYEVNKTPAGLQIILSRTHTDFVRRIFELEVPEVYDRTVEIQKLVREPGYRTKIAVYSNREDVDPVGACVGLRGVRIQAIVRELEGEKIDILKYDNDPRTFIKNALSPAEVNHVIILDEAKRQALAVVAETQLSLAIGKQGLNVRLANRLVDWNIDVKTEEQFAEMDIAADTKRAVSALFRDFDEEEDEITRISELPDVHEGIVAALKANGIDLIEQLVSLTDDDLRRLPGLNDADVVAIKQIVAENVEIIESEEEAAAAEESDFVEESEGEEPADGDASIGAEEASEPSDDDGYDDDAYERDEEAAGEGDPAATDEAALDEDLVEESSASDEDSEPEDDDEEEEEEITLIAELPGIDPQIVAKLQTAGIVDVVDLVSRQGDELRGLPGLTEDDVSAIEGIIEEFVEIIEEEDE